jgi:hypothetical protein
MINAKFFFSENMNIREQLRELCRIKDDDTKSKLLGVFSWLITMLSVLSAGMKLEVP